MKKLVMFFAGLLLLTVTCVAVLFSGAIYDSGKKLVIEPYFFQPDNLSSQRIGVPVTPADLGTDKVRERLIRRYITEYFYVNPDPANIEFRLSGAGLMARMSTRPVYDKWRETVGAEIQEMAGKRVLRLVKFKEDPNDNGIVRQPDSDYWEVSYELHTWDRPNDLAAVPKITRGIMFLAILSAPQLKPEVDIHQYMNAGWDPAALFKFTVIEIAGQ